MNTRTTTALLEGLMDPADAECWGAFDRRFRPILVGFGMPRNYAALVVGNQEAIRDGLGARVSDVVARVTGRPATPFADYAARAAPAWAPA